MAFGEWSEWSTCTGRSPGGVVSTHSGYYHGDSFKPPGPLKLKIEIFSVGSYFFRNFNFKSYMRGFIIVKIFGRLRRQFLKRFPLVYGKKTRFFFARFARNFDKISHQLFAWGFIFLKPQPKVRPRGFI